KGRKISRNLISDGEREAQHAIHAFLKMSSRACLLKENSDRTLHVWIGGAFAVVKVVVVFLIIVERTDLVQCFGVIGSDLLGQLKVLSRGERMHPSGYSRLKKERAVGAHLVEIQMDIWQ